MVTATILIPTMAIKSLTAQTRLSGIPGIVLKHPPGTHIGIIKVRLMECTVATEKEYMVHTVVHLMVEAHIQVGHSIMMAHPIVQVHMVVQLMGPIHGHMLPTTAMVNLLTMVEEEEESHRQSYLQEEAERMTGTMAIAMPQEWEVAVGPDQVTTDTYQ